MASRILREIDGSVMFQFKDQHKGQACAIIANGHSLCDTKRGPSDEQVAEAFRAMEHGGPMVAYHQDRLYTLKHDLRRIKWTIGVNRSWELLTPTYHVSLDPAHYEGIIGRMPGDPTVYDRLAKDGRLFVMSSHWPVGHIIPYCHEPGWPFSLDLTKGARIGEGSNGSVTYVALQLAVWMGFTRVYLMGFDLQGEHFHERWPPHYGMLQRQDTLFGFAARAIGDRAMVKVVDAGASLCRTFPPATFEEVIAECAA